MFTAVRNGADDPSRDGKPVLSLPETNTVLIKLLTLAYPAQSARSFAIGLADLDIFVDIYQAAHKYQFGFVQWLLAEMLESPVLLDAHPHRLFAIARVCGLPDLARKAALRTLASPIIPAPPAFPEMCLLTWADAHRLYEFHAFCGTNAHRIITHNAAKHGNGMFVVGAGGTAPLFGFFPRRIQNTKTHELLVWHNHTTNCRQDASTSSPAWFTDHMKAVAAKVLLVPSHHVVTAALLDVAPAPRSIRESCRVCSINADRDLTDFAHQLAADIERAESLLAENMFKDGS
ncbi:hypothetical protein DFH07DRAFT_1025416 [Mycena maculata]|uniref:BTB domain-containing protein n=1 Tax=Mycena maculata TaxID=230809 RepID=A0AAD7J7J7_9AGAR|nr:hypothetical protein DFH07DRAFT_1025416 [Mycena maculata]